jgi:hypothetical protein
VNEPNQSDRHSGMLKPTEQETTEFFEFGGRQLPLRGTSGPAAVQPRVAEGIPLRHDVLTTESHSGMLKPTEQETTGFFEFGGRQLPLQGTSGPAAVQPRTAQGTPRRHEVSTTDRTIPAGVGVSQVESRTAEGRPVQQTPAQDAATGPTGSGQLIGGPVRLA